MLSRDKFCLGSQFALAMPPEIGCRVSSVDRLEHLMRKSLCPAFRPPRQSTLMAQGTAFLYPAWMERNILTPTVQVLQFREKAWLKMAIRLPILGLHEA